MGINLANFIIRAENRFLQYNLKKAIDIARTMQSDTGHDFFFFDLFEKSACTKRNEEKT